MLAVTTDVLALVMSLFGAVCGVAITVLVMSTKADLDRSPRKNHPTSVVSPQSLHRRQQDILMETSRLIDELAEQASWNEWKWSYKYYTELSGKLNRDTLWNYYVDADNRGQTLPE